MNEMEKYLAAIEAAIESNNKKAIELLEGLATYVYQETHAIANNSSEDEQVVWDGIFKRAQALVWRIAQASPQIWD